MKKYDYIIWDFNGTIFDDVKISIDTMNVLLKKRNLKLIENDDEYKSVFGFPVINGYVKFGFNLEKENYDDIAKEWISEYLSREKEATLTKDILAALEYFKNEGYKQIIISTSHVEMLKRQSEEFGISGYFDEIVGIDNINAGGKVEVAKKWKEIHPDDRLLFIGDTDHDFLVASEIGAKCFLLSSGHQSYERLIKVSPDASVFKTISEILDYFKKQNG